MYDQFQRLWRVIENSASDPLEREHEWLAFLSIAVRAEGERQLPRARGCERAVARIREVIQDDCAARRTLAEMAALVGLSKIHLLRSFRERVGMPIFQFVKRVRAARALEMLRLGVAPIDAATAVGFFDQCHMSRAIKETYGLTPAAYRRSTIPRGLMAFGEGSSSGHFR